MSAERQIRGDATEVLRERRNDFAPERTVHQYAVDKHDGNTFTHLPVTHRSLGQSGFFELLGHFGVSHTNLLWLDL
jgi:hypothetical protein